MSDQEDYTVEMDEYTAEVEARLTAAEAIQKYNTQQTELLEQRFESVEMVNAQLVAAYGEIAAKLEAILHIMANTTDEERAELQRQLAAAHLRFLEMFKTATEINDASQGS